MFNLFLISLFLLKGYDKKQIDRFWTCQIFHIFYCAFPVQVCYMYEHVQVYMYEHVQVCYPSRFLFKCSSQWLAKHMKQRTH